MSGRPVAPAGSTRTGRRHPVRARRAARAGAGAAVPARAGVRRAVPPRPVAGPGRGRTATAARTTRPGGCWRRRSVSWRAGDCLVFATGQAAITGLLLARAAPRRHRAAARRRLLPGPGVRRRHAAPAWGYGSTSCRPPGRTRRSTGVRLVLLETPANPGLDVCDIAALAAAAHAGRRAGRGGQHHRHPARAAPAGPRCRPGGRLRHQGADRPLGSAARLCGDPVDAELLETVTGWRTTTGAVPGAFDAWLAHRSLATLDLRLARQSANAAALAELLAGRADVTGLRWPGCRATRRTRWRRGRCGGCRGCSRSTWVTRSGWPGSSSRPGWSPRRPRSAACTPRADRRAQWGDDTAPGFVRLSCGMEDTADLLADVAAALDSAGAAGPLS